MVCFVHRMLDDHGCDATLLWTLHFREVRSPTASGLEKRYQVACDCRVAAAHRLVRELMLRDLHTDELEPPPLLPTCGGVRRTNTRPCRNWEPSARR